MGIWQLQRTSLVVLVYLFDSCSVKALPFQRAALDVEAEVHRDGGQPALRRTIGAYPQLHAQRWNHTVAGRYEPPEETGAVPGHGNIERRQGSLKHKVQHVQLLNKPGLWVIMAAIIVFIGASVIRMEYSNGQAVARQGSSRDTNNDCQQAEAVADGGLEQSLVGFGSDRFLRLVVAVLGLNLSMLFWGIAQEYMMTTAYEDGQGIEETMPSALCLVLCNRLCTVLMTGSLLYAERGYEAFFTPVRWIAAMPAASNLFASWCQYQSLAYVSFPLQTAAKSAKLLPVILLSSLRGKKHSLLDYAEGLVIVSAVVVFGFEVDGDNGSTVEFSAKSLGVLFLCGLLFFDSITPHLQDYMFQGHPDLGLIQATFSMALSATGICLVALLCNGQLVASLGFFSRHPEAILHVLVLSLCSTMTQFLISFTIKHFGPVVFILITTTRQLISVCISAVLFMHHITTLAWLSALVVFCTVIGRTVRKPSRQGASNAQEAAQPNDVPEVNNFYEAGAQSVSLVDLLANEDSHRKLLICILGIHVPLGFYSVAQEFMATHTFDKEIFSYSMFLIAANRTGAGLLALGLLKMQGLPSIGPKMHLTVLPAAGNIVATFCQYKALVFLRYPAQALMKAAKVLPVMLCGRILKNRTYSTLDYCEGIVITAFVCFFMWSFNQDKEALSATGGALTGILLMVGYLVSDSMTSNAEDHIYQQVRMDPGQMLLGMQAVSGLVGWGTLVISGQLGPATWFLMEHPKAVLHVAVLVMAEACGAYACTVTVRLFGPAVFTLLLMSHQVLSLLVSVALFNHKVSRLSCFCLVLVALVVLTSSLRRVSVVPLNAAKDVKDP